MDNPLKKKRKVETYTKDGREYKRITKRSGRVVTRKKRKVTKAPPSESDKKSLTNAMLGLSGSDEPKDTRPRAQKKHERAIQEKVDKDHPTKPNPDAYDFDKQKKRKKRVERREKWKEGISDFASRFKSKKSKTKLKGKKGAGSGNDSSPNCKESMKGKHRKKCKVNV